MAPVQVYAHEVLVLSSHTTSSSTFTVINFIKNDWIYIIDTSIKINLNEFIMRIKEQIKYDLSSDQFTYLIREENSTLHKVDIVELNKRLNEIKKSNFWATTLTVILCLSFLAVITFIGLKF